MFYRTNHGIFPVRLPKHGDDEALTGHVQPCPDPDCESALIFFLVLKVRRDAPVTLAFDVSTRAHVPGELRFGDPARRARIERLGRETAARFGDAHWKAFECLIAASRAADRTGAESPRPTHNTRCPCGGHKKLEKCRIGISLN